MAPIDKAIKDLKSRGSEEQFTLKEVAEKHGVDRSTLGRRWRGVTGPRDARHASRQALNPQQELELVRYITKLNKQGLPPIREIIRNFLLKVTRFINRHEIYLILKWTTAMDRTRHLANSKLKYRLYFELLHRKITEYHLEARDIYNIDKKGFLIGLIGRTLIYVAKKGAIRLSWVEDIKAGEHEVFVLLSLTG
ncbi:hypothetical protein BU23DRAFT_590765 [Bimuria novae-zelandiae CBS 107.79]|uniref:HTH CENPB-type domain-containing protein n=1 Tax=Bimuria novae-zelandiae CBS 107.79 TaxID=1447943 RepID=A0A6A5V4F8_9PLEO|nr:hypothetical protein BU23DRAFT_590765 [Bimuria novae-zelandiae CBS 107.79]